MWVRGGQPPSAHHPPFHPTTSNLNPRATCAGQVLSTLMQFVFNVTLALLAQAINPPTHMPKPPIGDVFLEKLQKGLGLEVQQAPPPWQDAKQSMYSLGFRV